MSRLKRHIIQKYNNALCTVIEYYDLPVNRQYAKHFGGILYLDLGKFNIKGLDSSVFSSKEGLDELFNKYPFFFPFIKFQRQYINGDINENICIDYLLEINEVLKKIKE